MRRYFDLEFKGSRVAPYFIAGLIAVYALLCYPVCRYFSAYFYPYPSSPMEAVLDWSYAGNILMYAVVEFGILLAVLLPLFFVVKHTINGLRLGDDRFEADYNFKVFLRTVLKGAALTVVTLGIYSPWFITKIIRYFAGNTSFRFNTFRFNGEALMLFSIIVFFQILPVLLFSIFVFPLFMALAAGSSMAFLWIFLLIFAMMAIEALAMVMRVRWVIDFSYGTKRITSDMKPWQAMWFVLGQMLLSIITLGLYLPMYFLRLYRYYAEHTVLGEDTVEERFGFALNVWRDYFLVLGNGLLTLITLGIYWPWAYGNVMKRLLTRSYVENSEELGQPMPQIEE